MAIIMITTSILEILETPQYGTNNVDQSEEHEPPTAFQKKRKFHRNHLDFLSLSLTESKHGK